MADSDITPDTSTLEDSVNQAARSNPEPQNLDDALGAVRAEKTTAPKQPENLDEALGMIQQEKSQNKSALSTTIQAAGSLYDYASNPGLGYPNQAVDDFYKNTSGGRILQAFGYGVNAAARHGLDQQSEEELAKSGILNDVVDTHNQNHANFVEGLMKPASAGLGMELGNIVFTAKSSAEALYQSGTFQGNQSPTPVADELQRKQSAGESITHLDRVRAFNEAFERSPGSQFLGAAFSPFAALQPVYEKGAGALESVGIPKPVTELGMNLLPLLGAHEAKAPLPPEIAEAVTHGAIGVPESTYFGLTEPTAEQAANIHEARQQLGGDETEAVKESGPDIHEVARSIDPETFQKYDALTVEQERLRAQIGDVQDYHKTAAESELPHSEEDIQAMRDKISDANKRKAKIYQDRLDDMLKENEEHMEGSGGETAGTLALRRQIQELDYQKRDLAPAVSDAYRRAQEQLPDSETVGAPQETETTETKESPEATKANKEPEKTDIPTKPIEEQKRSIIDAEKQKLVAAGRPAEEAEAGAQLVAEHYAARSERFEGKHGTAQEMYERDGAHIRKGREVNKARELAQGSRARELEQNPSSIEMDMLHGSNAEGITKHDATKEGSNTDAGNMGSGSYASPSSAVARRYGKNLSKVKIRLDNPLEIMRDDNYQTNIAEKAKELGVEAKPVWSGSKQISKEFANEFRDKALTAGYDGAIARLPNNARDIVEAVSYRPEGAEFNQKSQGKIRLATDDAKATVTLMKTANASTFIHETGHHWFDELVRDSQHPDAPEQLKSDAKALLDYAGTDSDGNIPTRGHEKVARSFERYLMEGTAPSRGLARVFAQFKNWLTKIYQTADKLKAPITDDIRDIFDRLLSTNPEKTVLAADHEPGKMLADIHEADAKTTAPEHADAVRDTIEREIDHTARLHDPEVADAIKAAETSKITGPTAGNSESGSATGSVTGPTGIAEESGTQPTGSGHAGPESSAKPRGDIKRSPWDRKSSSSDEPDDSASGPNTVFGKTDTGLVDKAGNIRLDNLNTPEDINEVLRESAKENDNFMTARRGRISTGEQLDLADALGMDANTLDARKLGQAFNAEQILAARKLLIQSAESVREAMIKAANGDETDIMAYAEIKARHQMIQEQVSGITAEAGRALGAFRKLAGSEEAQAVGDFLKQATGQDLFQLQEEAKLGANLDTPQKVSKFINDANQTRWQKTRSMILEHFINSLLSGPITHLRYAAGNALNALWTPLVEIPTAAASGKIREIITGDADAERVHLGEVGAQLHGMLKGSRDGLRAASIAWKTGKAPLLPGEASISSPLEGFKVNAIPGLIGRIENIPSRGVESIHGFFKTLRYEQNLQSLAYRTATQEGLSGVKFTDRVADLTNSPTPEMMEASTAGALKELFMSPTDYNSFTGKLQSAINSNLAAKIIIPFMKIGSQITRNAFIERTPLGLFDRDVRENLFYKNGGAAQDMQLAKMATGIALMGTMSLMTMEGSATGDGPTDPAQRSIWLLDHTPNSIKIGDINIRYQGLGHLGMLMRFSANMTETAKGWDGEDGEKLANSFLEGITHSVLDENFMRGLKDMLDAVYHPEQYGNSYVRGFATNWLPFSVGLGQVAREIDPYQRLIDNKESVPRQILDSARSKIPFVSENLPERRDKFGEPIPNGAPLRNYAADPVVQKMENLQIGIGNLDRKILGVPLNEQQYDDYSRVAGRLTKMRLDTIIKQPGFNDLSNGTQIDIIHKTVSGSREAARNLVIADPNHPENRDIIRQAIEAKRRAIAKKN